MALDFPLGPVVGQQFPFTPVPGQPVFIWDGEKWVPAPVTSASGAVRYDTAQSLTTAQLVQARTNIYAAPFDAMAYSGMQINGGMEVGQERAIGTPTNTSGGHACDGWRLAFSGTMVPFTGQFAGSLSSGLNNYVAVGVTTAQPSLGAGHFTNISQFIEGYRVARLAWGTANAQPITICFWSSHVRAGVYSIAIHNAAYNRSYIAAYTQAVSSTPQYNVVTIPGDTTGTWDKTNTVGLEIRFTVASGTTYIAPAANVWGSTLYVAAPGQVNGMTATSDEFRITGVTVLPGTQAPTAAQSPNIMRPYDQELVTCMRYYRKTIGANNGEPTWFGYGVAGQLVGVSITFPAVMRAMPTIAKTGTWAVTNCGQPTVSAADAISYLAWTTITAAGSGSFQPNTSGLVSFDIRL